MKGAVHCGVSNPKEDVMAKILIMPQDWPKRLHEWVAIERGYFDEVGLEYRFRGSPPEWDELIPGGFVRKAHEEMVETDPTGFCDCSWGVVVSTGAGAGRFIPDFHTEAHLCIYARPDTGIVMPSDLAGKPIAVSADRQSFLDHRGARTAHRPQGYPPALHDRQVLRCRVLYPAQGTAGRCGASRQPARYPKRPAAADRRAPRHAASLEGTFKRLDYFAVIPDTDIRRFVQAIRLAQDELDSRPEDYLHYLWREVPRLEKLFKALSTRGGSPPVRALCSPFDAGEFARTPSGLTSVDSLGGW